MSEDAIHVLAARIGTLLEKLNSGMQATQLAVANTQPRSASRQDAGSRGISVVARDAVSIQVDPDANNYARWFYRLRWP